ncbi:hypothetical protein [Thermocoleostomius sinensis]|uniref:Uncharacterized protein n=1 Tax=Thermocoleostomius sinensis A174 TaxID=2016057 RepID=A0A9E8ZHH8_9CYAN|nr:hypothetical protein [Thermocoleostomius sinensis]WAL61388.1 hypothetical protein OXH18_05180 [Thermocoleostomius sinensis A174]
MVESHNTRKFNRTKLGLGSGLVLMAAIVAACGQPQTQTQTAPQTEPQTEAQTEPQAPVTSEDVSQNPEELLGQTVTIRGDINERLTTNVVELESEGFFNGEEILVVLPEGFALPAEDDVVDSIQVTGEVRQFTADEAQQLNLTIPETDYADYEGRPLIVAETAALSPSPNELSDNPDAFYNQTIALEGGIEELGPNTYRLTGDGLGGGEILVLSQQPLQENPDELDRVVVTGEPSPFDAAALQQQFGWDAELQQQLEQDYADRPVIVANEIYPLEK